MRREQQQDFKLRAVLCPPAGEHGYMLLGLIVAIAIILISLSVAASQVAFSLRREREVETERRAGQFVRAIRLFYIKTGHYPTSIEQLQNTNHVRYLRKVYVDPLTGKSDWRMIAVGQNKTTVKGFFGQPLTGLPTSGLGSAAGMQSNGIPGPGGASAGGIAPGTSAPGPGAVAAGVGPGSVEAGGAGTSNAGAGATGTGSTSSLGGGFGNGVGSQSATAFAGSGSGPIMGVGTFATGSSINAPNEQATYETWEFLYDPRIELLKQKAALNGGIGSVSGSSLGQAPGGFGSSSAPVSNTPVGPGPTTTPATPQP